MVREYDSPKIGPFEIGPQLKTKDEVRVHAVSEKSFQISGDDTNPATLIGEEKSGGDYSNFGYFSFTTASGLRPARTAFSTSSSE
jgi:hypothetical protein